MAKISKAAGMVAPNVGYGTFKAWFKGLRGSTPAKVDNTLFHGQSGSTISQLKGALTFLKLVDEDFRPTPAFGTLATVGDAPDAWPLAFKPILEAAYESVLEGVALNSTRQQLLEALRSRGNVSGETAQKAARFYTVAAEECSIATSPFWRVESGESGTPRTRKKMVRKTATERAQEEPTPPQAITPPGSKEYRLSTKVGEVVVWMPSTMTATSWKRALSYLEEELFEFQPESA